MNKRWLLLGLTSIFMLVLFLYGRSLGRYFFQDDWFTLSISQTTSFRDFLGFFAPRSDVIYYRPLGMQVYFFTLQKIFGLDARPFHVVAFLTHFLAIFCVWRLVQILTGDQVSSFLASFFYGIANIHFIPFYWSSTFPFLLGVVWYLVSIFGYIAYRKYNRLQWLVMSLLSFILGLLTNELVATLPLQLIAYDLLTAKKRILHHEPIVFFTVLIPYFFLRFHIGSVPLFESYTPSLSSLLSTLRTYFFWVFNWPEEVKNQFIGPLILSRDFVKDFSLITNLLALTTIIIVFFWMFTSLILFRTSSHDSSFQSANQRLAIFGVIWFAISVIPLLLFPNHTFPYYLAIPSIGLYLSWIVTLRYFTKYLEKKKKWLGRFMTLIISILWLASSIVSVRFNNLTHWASKRSRITSVLLEEMKRRYPQLPSSAQVFLPKDRLLRITLNDQIALNLFYHTSGIQTLYSEGKDEEREKFVPSNDTELIERYPFRIELNNQL